MSVSQNAIALPELHGVPSKIVKAGAPANTNLVAVEPANIIDMNIEALLREKGRNGEEMNPKQFASLAAEYLLQQYELAKAETTLHSGSSIGMFFNSINNASSKSLITIGLLSAFAVDIAVFGGGATLLIAKSPLFYGMAAASLLTATLIGTAEKPATRAAYTAVASALALAAAYQVSSDSPQYVDAWAHGFSSLDTTHQAAAAKAAIATDVKANLQTQVAALTEQVQHGGIGGRHVATDGNVHNDYLIRDLATAQAALDRAVADAAKTAADLRALGDKPSHGYGLAASTAYIGAWLTLAQLQVANIISKGPKWLKAAQDDAKTFKAKKEMIKALETNPSRVDAKLSAVLEKMKEFYLAGIKETQGDAGVKRMTSTLFTESNFDKMNDHATALFGDAIKRDDTAMMARAKRSAGLKPAELKTA